MNRAGKFLMCCIAFAVIGCATSREFGGDAPRMTVEDLKSSLGSADLAIIDVRLDAHWKESDYKIKGAVREDPRGISWASQYPREKTIVLYCA